MVDNPEQQTIHDVLAIPAKGVRAKVDGPPSNPIKDTKVGY